jgi:hypothetical protein
MLKLQPRAEGEGMEVMIAFGEKISSPSKCVQISIELQGKKKFVDFYILPLDGYGVVLGTQWLRILGPIRCDFETLEMQFVWDKEPIIQHGIKSRSGRSNKFMSLYLETAENNKERREPTGKEKEKEVEQLLEGYRAVFAKPMELPPPRRHDHRIILQKEASSVSVKPYRYPFFKKTEIEELVREMLDRGIIRPSNSPYSSLVLLVKKGDGTWRMCVDYRK